MNKLLPERPAKGSEDARPGTLPAVVARVLAGGDAIWLGRLRALGAGLSAKLLVLTILFVMLAEVLIFLPSVANYRFTWLNDRLMSAKLAALAAQAVPDGQVPKALREELLMSAQVRAIAVKRKSLRRLILQVDMPPAIDASYDFRDATRLGLVWDALAVFFMPDDKILRVIGRPTINRTIGLVGAPPTEDVIDIVLPVARLKSAMIGFALNILGLSVMISIITAALVYLALNSLLVRPMRRITHNMVRFSENPEDASRIIEPSTRHDEIGTAERELAHMQGQLVQMLQQKNRLAALGLAVSKINHDLRNMLASAQLISDRLSTLPDPTVQRFAPKLINSLDRAIKFCNDTLQFGRAQESAPKRELFALSPLVGEVGEALSLPREGVVDWQITVADDLQIDADSDQLFRVLSNLCRNAVEAVEAHGSPGEIQLSAARRDGAVIIEVMDTGPGIPAKAKASLFKAFQGSVRKGGTGLGLVIAAELLAAHGGSIVLVDESDTGVGAHFRLVVPDRAREI